MKVKISDWEYDQTTARAPSGSSNHTIDKDGKHTITWTIRGKVVARSEFYIGKETAYSKDA